MQIVLNNHVELCAISSGATLLLLMIASTLWVFKEYPSKNNLSLLSVSSSSTKYSKIKYFLHQAIYYPQSFHTVFVIWILHNLSTLWNFLKMGIFVNGLLKSLFYYYLWGRSKPQAFVSLSFLPRTIRRIITTLKGSSVS